MRPVIAFVISALVMLAAEAPVVFPKQQADNLEKKQMKLPDDFAGNFNLVLIAFKREQQKDLDSWLKALPKVAQAHPGFAYYELPVIARMNGVMRWFINSGMRSGIPNKQQRARTITLYIDKKPFEEALKIPSEDQVYALLLDRKGAVVWRAEGLYSEEKGRSLEAFLSTSARD